jgi:hypothetical protein
MIRLCDFLVIIAHTLALIALRVMPEIPGTPGGFPLGAHPSRAAPGLRCSNDALGYATLCRIPCAHSAARSNSPSSRGPSVSPT